MPSIAPEMISGHALEHDAVAEDARERDQEHHGADVDQAAFERLAEAAQPQHAVDEDADRDRVDHREGADLRRREDAEAQPDQQEDREQDRPDAAAEASAISLDARRASCARRDSRAACARDARS